MAHVSKTLVIDAPPERVFDYRLNVPTLPEYNRDVSDLRPLRGGQPRKGTAYTFTVHIARVLPLRATLTIGEIDRPRRIEFFIESLMNAREVCTFEPVENPGGKVGTRVTLELTVDTPGGPLAPLIDSLFVLPNARRQVVRELGSMKLRIERL